MLVKLLCGQMDVVPGRPDLNYAAMRSLVAAAKAEGADILVLPELCLPGYLIGDVWEQQSFIDDCLAYTQELAAEAQGLVLLFGSVAQERDKLHEDGRPRKYNAAYACQDGRLLPGYLGRNFFIKNALPNYREFDDARHFYSLHKLCGEEGCSVEAALQPLRLTIRGEEVRLGLLLCEDGWTENYHFNVPQILAAHGAQLLINLSSSPYSLGKNRKRHRLFSKQAQACRCPLIYVNNVGSQNNGKDIFTYDGCTSAYAADGSLAASAPMYAATCLTLYWDTASGAISSPQGIAPLPRETGAIFQALKYGSSLFLQQCGIERMTVGLSGGIDSAVAAALYCHILGPEQVLLLNLPSAYNSQLTQSLAAELAANLGANYAVLPIGASYAYTVEQLQSTPIRNLGSGRSFHLQLSPLALENIQARDRGARLIAAAASAFGGAFSCNSNKAEISVGYATFYGDICGALAVLGDIWKHQVYALGRYLNQAVYRRPVIPEGIFTIRPSAELSSSQTVGRGGDPLLYPYHDYLLRAFVENWHKSTPWEIASLYAQGPEALAAELKCDPQVIKDNFADPAAFFADLERWWKLFAGFSVAKRIQAPPIVAISKRAFGYDHREAQLTPYFSRAYLALKEALLNP